MKREIKFRGLRVDGKGWVVGYYWKDNTNGKHKITVDLSDDNFRCHEVIPETVGQYTGLKDKNGVQICEADILKFTQYVGGNFVEYCYETLEVIFQESYAGFRYKRINNALVGRQPFGGDEIEVIGNVHEHKYLLK